ncbi:MAG: HAD-IA family hydrolase [Gammaproteobacteria bacterium]|nr:HAD-IA family hydrolase [Gammaproteobacteria bacterium]
MKYKLAIFDWDGTVMDSVARIVSCVKSAQRRTNLPLSSELAIKNIIGLSLDAAMQQLHPDLNDQAIVAMVDAYRDEYIVNDQTPSPIFNGVDVVLEQLAAQGIQIAVATGKGRGGLDRVIEISGFGHYFCDTVCASEANSKPDPQMIELLLGRLGIARSEAVMIGDSTLDMEMARRAGIDAIGVTYGVHERTLLAQYQPKAIVDTPNELLAHML